MGKAWQEKGSVCLPRSSSLSLSPMLSSVHTIALLEWGYIEGRELSLW